MRCFIQKIHTEERYLIFSHVLVFHSTRIQNMFKEVRCSSYAILLFLLLNCSETVKSFSILAKVLKIRPPLLFSHLLRSCSLCSSHSFRAVNLFSLLPLEKGRGDDLGLVVALVEVPLVDGHGRERDHRRHEVVPSENENYKALR